MGVDLRGVLELRLDLLRQLFAQFDSDDAERRRTQTITTMLNLKPNMWFVF